MGRGENKDFLGIDLDPDFRSALAPGLIPDPMKRPLEALHDHVNEVDLPEEPSG